ncbi:MAG TPA: hypothetical protein VFB14_24125 [Bryobacteraceae bacterium]|jgi:hypothetical protein|nr:hypothetical protein [Bryobacteraceae bacterium]
MNNFSAIAMRLAALALCVAGGVAYQWSLPFLAGLLLAAGLMLIAFRRVKRL